MDGDSRRAQAHTWGHLVEKTLDLQPEALGRRKGKVTSTLEAVYEAPSKVRQPSL